MALREDYRHHLTVAHRDCGFKYVRFHGILNDDMSVLLPGNVYSFFNIDSIFDFLLSIGMKPLIELSFMPELLASTNETVFHYKGNISPPKSYPEFNKLLAALFTHLIERYGAQEVHKWPVEVWNEPNCGFFAVPNCCGPGCGDKKLYFELYANMVRTIKGVDKQIRVGGPSTAQLGWIPDLLEFVVAEQLPIDFVSSHLYPTDPDVRRQRNGFDLAIAEAAAQASASSRGKLPFYVTEYNPGLGIDAADTPYGAAFVAHVAATGVQNIPNLEAFSYWTFSDIFEEQGFDSLPFNDKFGLQTIHGVPKPAYRVFQLLHMLGDARVETSTNTSDSTIDVVVTVTDIGGRRRLVRLMACNYNYLDLPLSAHTVNLTLQAPQGAVFPPTAFASRVDSAHSNPRQAWIAAGKPAYPTVAQIEAMRAASRLTVQPLPVTRAGAAAVLSFPLPAYGVLFAELEVTL